MNFHLTLQAVEDFKDIANYTQKTWGIKQRNIYLKKIDTAFNHVAKNPNLGQACKYIRHGYFKYNVGKHIIFYRQITKVEIQIVRILHSSMDIENHL